MELTRKELEIIKGALITEVHIMAESGPAVVDSVDMQSSFEEYDRDMAEVWSLGDRVRAELDS